MFKRVLDNWRSRKWEDLEERGGIFYEKKTNTPFTGVLWAEVSGFAGDNRMLRGEFVEGQREGLWEETRDDLVFSIEPYRNGEIHGVATRYHGYSNRSELKKKKIQSKTEWTNGKFKVETEYHDYNGAISQVTLPLSDNREGNWRKVISFYPSGNLKADYDTKNGSKEGHFVMYDELGELFRKGIYKNDKKEGYWIANAHPFDVRWSDNLSGTYRDGVLVSEDSQQADINE